MFCLEVDILFASQCDLFEEQHDIVLTKCGNLATKLGISISLVSLF